MSTQQGSQVFRLGGPVLGMFWVFTVVGFGMSGLFIYGALSGREPGWPAAAFSFLGALFLLGLCLHAPGVMTVSEGEIEIKRRFGTQRLRWSEIESVRWTAPAVGLASLASDNWQVEIDGRSDGKPVKIILHGSQRGAASAGARAARGAAAFEIAPPVCRLRGELAVRRFTDPAAPDAVVPRQARHPLTTMPLHIDNTYTGDVGRLSTPPASS